MPVLTESNQHPENSYNKKSFLKKMTRLFKSKTGVVGLSITFVVFIIAIFAGVLSPYDPNYADPSLRLIPPAWTQEGSFAHILGTDNMGRDLLSQILYGSRVSLMVGICSIIVAGFLGLVAGVLSGYYGGTVDAIIMRFVDTMLSIPNLLLMMVILIVTGPGIMTVIFVLGVTHWTAYARVVRSEVLTIKTQEYVKASKAVGASTFSIIGKHFIPNFMASFIVISTTSVATAIIGEASLSFLGLGVKESTITWGKILSDGREYLATSWWVSTFSGIAITITVLGFIFLGDWLRDILDPKLKQD